MWAVSPEPLDKMRRYAEQNSIEFPFLSDPDLAVTSEWGLANPDNPSVPHPTAVVVDSTGEIRYFRQDIDYTKRPSPVELLEALDGLIEAGEAIP